ncbi:MAG: hypothetical protein D6738_02580 [Acidobacteria bacterium]|nr:MAG: hypothetical protein D6738_02580 [Acidobacteriota bacterium]
MDIIRVLIVLAAAGASVPAVHAAGSPADAPQPVHVGIVLDGPHARSFDFTDLLRDEILRVTEGRYAVIFDPDAVIDGGWTRDGVHDAVDRMLARPGLDLVLAVGVDAAVDICTRPALPVPVVVPLSISECTPSCPAGEAARINTLRLSQWIANDLRAFREVVPFRHVVVVGDPWIVGCDTDGLASRVAPPGTEVTFLALTPGEQAELPRRLPAGADAVYLMRLQQIDDSAFAALVDELTRAGLPTFSMLGEQEVRQGVLAGLNTRATIEALARGAAVDVLDTLDGVAPAEQPFAGFEGRISLNMRTAARLGIGVSWELLSSARLIDEEAGRGGEPIDLRAVMDLAERANLALAADRLVVAAGEQSVRAARGALRPQIGVSVAEAAIDPDRAFAALGQYERSTVAGVSVSQWLFSDPTRAAAKAQQEAQRGRVADYAALRLDVRRQAAGALLGLLKAEALVRVRQDDVDLTRANLGVARLQHSLGSAGLAVVRRWEAALATARARLLEARAVRRLAERELSRVLDRPLTTTWRVAPLTLDEGLEVLGGADLARQLDSPDGFANLMPVLIERGLEASPELASLDAAIAAQEQLAAAARRRGRVPQVRLQGSLEQVLAKDEGGTQLALPPGLLPDISDRRWSAVMSIELPVATGGAITATANAERRRLEELRLRRQEVAQRVRLRVLAALDQAAASWPAISLRRDSAAAAADSLRLVQDAYGRGAASVLDLLDAQNAALTARLAARTSVYDFLDDWTEVLRSVGRL